MIKNPPEEVAEIRMYLQNRYQNLNALHPNLKPQFSDTDYRVGGKSFHLVCSGSTLNFQLHQEDWMMTISLLDGTLDKAGNRIPPAELTVIKLQSYKPNIKDGISGWVDDHTGGGFVSSKELFDQWNEYFNSIIFP